MRFYKGKYKLKNINKYIGNKNNIIYRSSWEKRFMKYCDSNNNIVSWSSEELYIPYVSPIDNKYHKYYPDFLIKIKDNANKFKIIMIEIKPHKETIKPLLGKRKRRTTFLTEMSKWAVNSSKWQYAQKYCQTRNWEFKILTEEHIL